MQKQQQKNKTNKQTQKTENKKQREQLQNYFSLIQKPYSPSDVVPRDQLCILEALALAAVRSPYLPFTTLLSLDKCYLALCA